MRVKGQYQNGTNLTKSEEQERVYYTERGVMEICRWSTKPKTNIFMDWVWDIVYQYRHNELISFNDLSNLTGKMSSINNTLNSINQTLLTLEKTINSIKSNTEQPKLPKRKYSAWTSRMFPKYQLLMDYFQISRKDLYKNLFLELQNTYPDIDLNHEIDDYCYFNHVESAYTMEVIEHSTQLRTLFESVVNNLLLQHNLVDSTSKQAIIPTIFDTFSGETA